MKEFVFVWWSDDAKIGYFLFWCPLHATWHVTRSEIMTTDDPRDIVGLEQTELASHADFAEAWKLARGFADGSDEPDVMEFTEGETWAQEPRFSLN